MKKKDSAPCTWNAWLSAGYLIVGLGNLALYCSKTGSGISRGVWLACGIGFLICGVGQFALYRKSREGDGS
jgi:hypothetical protein